MEEILGDLPTNAHTIRDHVCETALKVVLHMWLQILWARVGTSRKEILISGIWAPKPRFLESGRNVRLVPDSVCIKIRFGPRIGYPLGQWSFDLVKVVKMPKWTKSQILK